jgi:hypothetical protein
MLFFIVETPKKIPESYIVNKDSVIYRHWTDIKNQAHKIGYNDLKIEFGHIQNAPRSVSSAAICFLDECTLIESDYLIKCISAHNLYRNSSCICGPVINEKKQDFEYKLNSYNSLSYKINDEVINYPRMNNIVIPALFYNKVSGYSPCITHRKTYYCDLSFFAKLSSYGDIVYLTNLLTNRINTEGDSDEIYYYNLAYEHEKFGIEKMHINNAYQIGRLECKSNGVINLF